jgi:hypothetical protein
MKKIFTFIFASLMSASMFGENLIAGVKAPTENCPTSVALCVMPEPDLGELFAMELNSETGWFVAYEAEANEADKFKFVDANDPTMVLCKYVAESDVWVQAVMKFGDVWEDDSWKGTPVKWVELDFSAPGQYAWMSGKPDVSGIRTMKATTADKGAWFDLNGRRLNGAPTAKGVYIKNGKKFVIK